MKAIIFDLDGVLVSTDRYHYEAWKKIAEELNIYFDEAVNNKLRGIGRRESLDIILGEENRNRYTEEEKNALTEKKNRIYRRLLDDMNRDDVRNDVRDMLSELRRKGYRLAVGSSSRNAGFILDKVELTDSFDAVSDGNNITRSKPYPDVFLKAAEYLGVNPGECIVVEDACSGIDAAKAGGMYAAGIGEAKKYEKADYCLEKVGDILNILR